MLAVVGCRRVRRRRSQPEAPWLCRVSVAAGRGTEYAPEGRGERAGAAVAQPMATRVTDSPRPKRVRAASRHACWRQFAKLMPVWLRNNRVKLRRLMPALCAMASMSMSSAGASSRRRHRPGAHRAAAGVQRQGRHRGEFVQQQRHHPPIAAVRRVLGRQVHGLQRSACSSGVTSITRQWTDRPIASAASRRT